MVARDRLKKLSQITSTKYKISTLQQTELAGFKTARFVRKNYGKKKNIVIAAGSGNSGGSALVAARHLANHGKNVTVFVRGKRNIKKATNRNIETLTAMGVAFTDELGGARKVDVLIDALVGYGLKGNLRHQMLKDINTINALEVAVVSIDCPSGIDVDSGLPMPVAVMAKHTLQIALPKEKLEVKYAKPFAGKLHLLDIGIPRKAYSELRIPYPF